MNIYLSFSWLNRPRITLCLKKHVLLLFLIYILKIVSLTVFLFFLSWTVQPWESVDTNFQHHPSCLQDLCHIYLYAMFHFRSLILFLDLKLNHCFIQSAVLSFKLFLLHVHLYIVLSLYFWEFTQSWDLLFPQTHSILKTKQRKLPSYWFSLLKYWLHVSWICFSLPLFLFSPLISLDPPLFFLPRNWNVSFEEFILSSFLFKSNLFLDVCSLILSPISSISDFSLQ